MAIATVPRNAGVPGILPDERPTAAGGRRLPPAAGIQPYTVPGQVPPAAVAPAQPPSVAPADITRDATITTTAAPGQPSPWGGIAPAQPDVPQRTGKPSAPEPAGREGAPGYQPPPNPDPTYTQARRAMPGGAATPVGTTFQPAPVPQGGRAPQPTTAAPGPTFVPGQPPSPTATVPGGIITSTATPGQPSPWGGVAPANPGQRPGPQPGQPAAAPAFLTPFGPGNTLIGQQINPLANGRLQGTQSAVDAATGALAGDPGLRPFGGIDAGGYQDAADTARARALTAQALERSATGPSRQSLAQQALEQFISDTDPGYQARLQDVGRRAAALGTVGSGMTADDVVRLGRSREQEIVAESGRLARETAAQQLADDLARVESARGVAGQFQGQDLAGAGFQQGLRQEQRGERGAGIDYDLARRGVARDDLRTLQDLEDQQFAQGVQQRGELRDERGYQYGLSRDATGDAVQQRLLEEQLLAGEEERARQRAALAAGIGFGGTPSAAQLDAAGGFYGAGTDALGAVGAGIRPSATSTARPVASRDINVLSPGDYYDPLPIPASSPRTVQPGQVFLPGAPTPPRTTTSRRG